MSISLRTAYWPLNSGADESDGASNLYLRLPASEPTRALRLDPIVRKAQKGSPERQGSGERVGRRMVGS
jgi:hypothetical protein